MNGLAFFRFHPTVGWMLTAWVPSTLPLSKISVAVHHHEHKDFRVMVVQATFAEVPRKGRFCKLPHKLIIWPSKELERLAA